MDLKPYYFQISIDYAESYENGLILGWSCPGVGFGTLTFALNGDKLTVDTENMSDAFVLAVFKAVSNHLPGPQYPKRT